MNTELVKAFQNDKFGNVRVVLIGASQEPYFVGKDVAQTLGYTTMQRMYDHVEEVDKILINPQCHEYQGSCENGAILEPNKNVFKMLLINESGLYDAIFGSKLPSAKEFKRWVTSEVLPTIRTHGAYMTDNTLEKALASPDFLIQLATNLKHEKEARAKAESKIEQDKPKVLFADAVSASKTSILIGDLAKLIKQNGVEIGQKRLFEWMRQNGYLIKRQGCDYNSPTQRAMELGLFEVKETAITHSDGHVSINKTTKVTGKGQQYFIHKFLSNR